MSEQAPKGVYMYQPHPVSKRDGQLWAIGGLSTAMFQAEAEAVVDAINNIAWLMKTCHVCGHTLIFESTGCPRCGAKAAAPWEKGGR